MSSPYIGFALSVMLLFWAVGTLPALVVGASIYGARRSSARWPEPTVALIGALTLKPTLTTGAFFFCLLLLSGQGGPPAVAALLAVLGPGVTAGLLWRFRAGVRALPRPALALLLALDGLRWSSAYLGTTGEDAWRNTALAAPSLFAAVAALIAYVGRQAPDIGRRIDRHHLLAAFIVAGLGLGAGLGAMELSRIAEEKPSPGAIGVLARDRQVYSVAWSPDGATWAAAGYSDTVYVYGTDSRAKRLRFVAPVAKVEQVVWRPQGDMLAVQTPLSLHLVDAAGGAELRGIWLHATDYEKLRDRVVPSIGQMLIDWSPDGRWLAVAGWDDGRLLLLDPLDPAGDRWLSVPGGAVAALAWRPATATLATAGGDGLVRLWDAASGAEQPPGEGLALSAESPWRAGLAWRTDGGALAGWNAYTGVLRVWTLPGLALRELGSAGRNPIVAAAWRPNSDELAVGWSGGTAGILGPGAGLPVPIAGCGGGPLAWSPDGRWLAALGSSREICLRDLERSAERRLRDPEGDILDLAWHPTRPLLASADSDGEVRIWPIAP